MLTIFYRSTMLSGFFVMALMLVITSCGGGDGSTESQSSTIAGQASFPDSAGGGPVADASFDIVDLEKPPGSDVVTSGTTDSNGRYSASVPLTSSAAVIVNGAVEVPKGKTQSVRVSGLVNPNTRFVAKNFDGITDIACEAGFTAVRTGAITAQDLNEQRINNLELAAIGLVDSVNFLDPASVTAAANLVRQITNDGANPP
jgi:hypothetical protein